MSVHQVEEYYINIISGDLNKGFSKENISKVDEFLSERGEDYEITESSITVDGFDMESQALDLESDILSMLNEYFN